LAFDPPRRHRMVEDGRCHVMAAPDLLAFAEDPQVFVAIGPDQERIMTERDRAPGSHRRAHP
jgi:hypothetical protein